MHSHREHLLEQSVAEEPAVPQKEHAGLQMPDQARRHGGFATTDGLDLMLPDDVGAGRAQGEDACLGKCARGPSALGPTENACQFGPIENEAIDGHQPHAAVKSVGRFWRGQQLHGLFGQMAQRSNADAGARFAQGRGSRRRRFAVVQPSKHLGITVAAMERQPNDEPDDKNARQPFAEALIRMSPIQDRLHGFARNDTLQTRDPFVHWQCSNAANFLVETEHCGLLARWGLGHTIMAGGYFFCIVN